MEALRKQIGSIIPATIMGCIDYYRSILIGDLKVSGPFNEQMHRIKIFRQILEYCDVRAIVETGTFRASTTEFMASTADVPIFTTEYSPRFYEFARRKLRGYTTVQSELSDSRSFLRRLMADSRLPNQGTVFFYLDAHWNADLPLAEELEIIFRARKNSIVMIDDFEVPSDSGYAYDDYGQGKALSYKYIESIVKRYDLECFAPSIGAKEETGARRGCAVLTTTSGQMSQRLRSINALVKVPS